MTSQKGMMKSSDCEQPNDTRAHYERYATYRCDQYNEFFDTGFGKDRANKNRREEQGRLWVKCPGQ